MTDTSFDPRTGDQVAAVDGTPPGEVTAAVRAAAVVAPIVADVAPTTRRAWLFAVAEGLEAHRDELVALADLETALGVERLTGELARAAAQLRFYGEVAVEGSYLGLTIDEATATVPRLVRVNQPLGPVAVFGASNFPFAFGVLGNDTAAALAAGCPVVVKAHPAHLSLSLRLARIAREALAGQGAPSGTFQVVVGLEAGGQLVGEPGIGAVAFTGSQAGGLALWRLANEREFPVPVFAEMGTINPVVVTRAAATDMAGVAAGYVGSFTLGAGQFCTKPGLLLAPAGTGAAAAVGAALVKAAPAPLMLTENIASSVISGLAALEAAGARPIERVDPTGPGWLAPAAVLEVSTGQLVPGSRLLEECFGAVGLVAEYSDDADLAATLGHLNGCLAASLFAANDDPDAVAYLNLLIPKVGRVAVNDWPTGVATTWAQQHGGPWPSTSRPEATSVGAAALTRFVRPVSFQSVPESWLPVAARKGNPWNLPRRQDGVLSVPS
jgi:NADP-dependent aldehyde dehydrogenase